MRTWLWECELGLDTDLDVAIGRVGVGSPEERTGAAGGKPSTNQQVLIAERLHDRAEPAPQVAKLRRPTSEQRHQGARSRRRAEKVRQRVGALGELDGLHPGLVE